MAQWRASHPNEATAEEEFWQTRAVERAERRAERAELQAERRARKAEAEEQLNNTTWAKEDPRWAALFSDISDTSSDSDIDE